MTATAPPRLPSLSLDPAGPLSLRDYQEDALAAITAAQRRGITRPLVALPTGTGKTVVFAELIHRRGGRALVLAHRDELVTQAVEKLHAVDPTVRVGVVKAESDEHDAPVVVASVQTLAQPHRLRRLVPDFTMVVVDEAHHATAETYRRIIDHAGSFNGGVLTLGVTATPERADGHPLGDVWQEIVYRREILDMIQGGYLADLRAVQVQLAVDFNRFHTRAGDFIESQVAGLLAEANAPVHVLNAYQEHATGRKALLFTPSVALAHAMAETFRGAGIPADALDGSTPTEERRALLGRFRRGETTVLANCAVLTEGFDEPSADCIIVARPTRSRPLYIQMIGRGTRPYPGKDDCLILDLVGATTRHDLQTTAALFDLAPAQLAGRTVAEAVAARDAARAAAEAAAPDAPLPGRLVARAVDLFRQRPLHWVAVAGGRFVLSVGDGFLSLEQDSDGEDADRWRVAHTPRGERPQTLARGLPLGYAQGFAEDQARRLGAGGLLNPAARWRRDPATDKQIRLLHRRGVPCRPGLTKGEAHDLITGIFAATVAS